MRPRPFFPLALTLAALTLAGCDLAEGLLKLGFWSGVIVVVLVLVVVWLIARSVRGRSPRP